MSGSSKQKFLVQFLIPASVMAGWATTDASVRQASEQKMMAAWRQWENDHAAMILSSEAGGRTKRITSAGISDTRNDIVVCSVMEADSHDAATKALESHPHLQIPQASIEVMYLRPMTGM